MPRSRRKKSKDSGPWSPQGIPARSHYWGGVQVQGERKARGSPGSGRAECGWGLLFRPSGGRGPSAKPHALPSQGKFIRINFDVAGYIVGANIETCILPGPRAGAWGGRRLGIHHFQGTGVYTHRKPWLPAAWKPCLSFPLSGKGRIAEPQERIGTASTWREEGRGSHWFGEAGTAPLGGGG